MTHKILSSFKDGSLPTNIFRASTKYVMMVSFTNSGIRESEEIIKSSNKVSKRLEANFRTLGFLKAVLQDSFFALSTLINYQRTFSVLHILIVSQRHKQPLVTSVVILSRNANATIHSQLFFSNTKATLASNTTEKMKFSNKDFFSKY